MRWNEEPEYRPDNGTLRRRKRFLWFPKTIDGQTRWLETAEWQEYSYRMTDPTSASDWISWIPNRWLN